MSETPAAVPREGQVADARVVRLSVLELTYRASTSEEAKLKRRFMTLSVPSRPDSAWRGGVGYVAKATSLATGEAFALKRLKERVGAHDGAEPDERAKKLAASFRQEYDTHRLLSPTGLVPRIFGWATVGGEPAILMEWVEGLTLQDAAEELAGPDGKVPLTTVADIGVSVLGALRRIEAVDATLVHRDLSPRNIMVRTAERPLSEQAASGIYDICLVDFGSATVDEGAGSSFTVAENLWRGATPDYAPPEMLAHDLDGLVELRKSPSIDVYALCSVLYELYAGQTPYDVAARVERVPYQVKSTEPPRALERREGDADGALAGTILSGLAARQAERPSVGRLADELVAWEESRGTSRPWESTLDSQMASDATAVPKSNAPLSPTVLRMSALPAQASSAPTRPGFLRRHLRAAIACLVALVLVVGVCAAGSQTHWFGIEAPNPKASVNDYSWSELSRISQRIADAADGNAAAQVEAEYHLVNGKGELDFTQTKDIELSDGTKTSARIVGFRHDDKSDGSGKAGISFVFSEPVAKRPMDAQKTAKRGWDGTDLREWLAQDFAGELPAELRDELVEVEKRSVTLVPSDGTADDDVSGSDDDDNDAYYRASVEETDDELWVCSLAEQGGLLAGDQVADALHLSNDEIKGAAYDLYADRVLGGEVTSENVDELASAADDDAGPAWLRTPSEQSASGYDATGDQGYASCTRKLGVVPGFCV